MEDPVRLAALFEVPEEVLDALEVPLLAEAPLDAPAALFAEPEVVEPFEPLLAGLLKVELLVAFDVPFVPAEADSVDPALLLAPLLVLPLLAEALRLAAPDFAALALSAALAVEELVAEVALLELLEADELLAFDALLAELSFAERVWLALELLVELLVLELELEKLELFVVL